MANNSVERAGSLDHVGECRVNLPSIPSISKSEIAFPPKRKYKKFLRGPIPLIWLSMAAQLSGKALNLGIALWYLAGLTKSFTVKPTRATLTLFGMSRWSVSRNLRLLESAGLVTVERHNGKAPLVTIVEEPRSTVASEGQDWGDAFV
jgi:hypothetical protein